LQLQRPSNIDLLRTSRRSPQSPFDKEFAGSPAMPASGMAGHFVLNRRLGSRKRAFALLVGPMPNHELVLHSLRPWRGDALLLKARLWSMSAVASFAEVTTNSCGSARLISEPHRRGETSFWPCHSCDIKIKTTKSEPDVKFHLCLLLSNLVARALRRSNLANSDRLKPLTLWIDFLDFAPTVEWPLLERDMRKGCNALVGVLALTSASGATTAVPTEAAELYVPSAYKTGCPRFC
jgi:hypothetical protein